MILIFAWTFVALSLIVLLLQLALLFGAPLGEYTLGGQFPGKLPPKIRAAVVVQIAILLFFNLIVMARSQLFLSVHHDLSRIGIWFVVAFFVLGAIMNLASPSPKEKMTMGPLNLLALLAAFMVAML
jgi:hypothetical protein